MSLPPGTRIGPYEIRQPLGAGGMGEVYRARDARLDRDVAIKALPASTNDPERISRFRREAQILAGLSHPHIAALYGLEEVETAQFLVMELVEGGTLSERLTRGPLPLREALTIARQMADALQAAHDRGIIHRDLKPANIAFTADGHAKVLDFGLAKAFSVSPDAPTVATAATQSGVVLGTAAYMSPEQARGLPLDKRTDIFAFGCVLYEMLTASNPFATGTVSDIIVAILGREPDWTLLPRNTPARIHWLLRRCLEKDPKRRLHDIADARIELDEALMNPADSGALNVATVTPGGARVGKRELIAWALAGASLIAAVALLSLRSRPEAPVADARAFNAIVPLQELPSSAAPEQVTLFSLSPDGTKLLFVGPSASAATMLWVRPLDSPVATPIAGTEGATYPFWSADARQVGFIWRQSNEITGLAGRLKRVPVTGGEPVSLAELKLTSIVAWGANGTILFTPAGNAPLHQVRETGGETSPVTILDTAVGHVQHGQPFFLPDSRHFLYTAVGTKTGGAITPHGIYVSELGKPESARILVEGATHPAYANGYLLFLQGSTLMAQPFDLERLQTTASATPLSQAVDSRSSGGIGGAFSVSTTGTLAYHVAAPTRSQLAWFDRSGKPLELLGDRADWLDVVLSPDGTRVASAQLDPSSGTRDIWILDVQRRFADRFTSSSADDIAPVWSPKGDRLIFSSARGGRVDLYQKVQPLDEERRIADHDLPLGKFASSWSPDGQSIMFIAGARLIARSDLMLLPVSGGTPETFLDSPMVETQARFSPDGRWVAYSMNASGRLEVYVKPFRRPGQPIRISSGGGRWPLWRRDQQELVFLSADDTLTSASLHTTSDAVVVKDARPLFKVKLRPQVRLDAFPYDMTGDAQRFLVNTFVEEPRSSSRVTLLINWPQLLKK
jgi:serine/threonine protein kinase/dipeptidyl aminopeptidase/acylaminoacyl peptidase